MKVPELRRPYDKVGGIVFFGRMLDKIRLNAQALLPPEYNLGTADYGFFDARCTRFLKVRYEDLAERVLAGGTDDEILGWCFTIGQKPNEEEIEIWNDFMIKRGWHDAGSEELEKAKAALGLRDRDDIQTWFALHDADENRPNQALQHNDPSCHESCLRTPRASRDRG